MPQGRERVAVGLGQHGHHLLTAGVLVGQPEVGRARVVATIEAPLLLDAQVALEPQQGVGRGHLAAGEEVPAHPVVLALGLERVEQFAVHEDVHEQPPARTQPARDAREQGVVVAQVLEHLDRHAAVVGRLVQLQAVDVLGDDADVVEAALAAARLDELALRTRIGHGGDARARKALGHPQRERAPAAAEFEDVLAVGEFGAGAIQGQHGLLALIQALRAAREVAAGVLQALAEAQLEEARRQFVVLRIGRVGVQRQGTVAQGIQARALALVGALHIARTLFAQALRTQAAHAQAQQRVGHQAALGEAEQAGRGTVLRQFDGQAGAAVHDWRPLGNQGMKALVLRW